MYYNTTSEEGKLLKHNLSKAISQTDAISHFFKTNPGKTFTPYEVWSRLFDETTPITSVRRSITTLTNDGILEKTDEKKVAQYGRFSYAWRLK